MTYRFHTREVIVGNIGIGDHNPIRIQSMTNTDTMNTSATVDQVMRLVDAGCELVRITTPGVREAENLLSIKNGLVQKGYHLPLIADIHFNPTAAETAASIVEKIRINPGNYTDRNRGKFNFTEEEYQDSIHRIQDRIAPLIDICKRNNTAVRIGSNHGSLSERIVDRFGDTPLGMVESAMEFVRICRGLDFHNIVLSMKASNVRIMVYATRLLVKKMIDEGMDYPIHLGVTEAGDGMQGRIKSAVGIGTLLADGIGDTIRVSLTEDPVNEIPVAQKIASYFKASDEEKTSNIFQDFFYSPFEYNPRESSPNSFLSEYPSPIVIGWDGKNQALNPDIPASFIKSNEGSDLFSNLNPSDLTGRIPDIEENKVICYQPDGSYSVKDFRHLFRALNSCKINNPVILHKKYATTKLPDLVIESAIDFGPLFLDGFGEGIFIECDNLLNKGQLSEIAFQVLQASGARISQTEYIACPSCGRTLYDIQSALKSIKNETSHLTGLKIAVMGCIVNGPGEMADADYGYVGMGRGKVALYKGKKQVKSGVDENMAVQQLIELIKTGGDWHEPQ